MCSSPTLPLHPTPLSIYIFATSTLVPKPAHTALQPPDYPLGAKAPGVPNSLTTFSPLNAFKPARVLLLPGSREAWAHPQALGSSPVGEGGDGASCPLCVLPSRLLPSSSFPSTSSSFLFLLSFFLTVIDTWVLKERRDPELGPISLTLARPTPNTHHSHSSQAEPLLTFWLKLL